MRRAILAFALVLAASMAQAQNRTLVLLSQHTLAAAETYVTDPVRLAPGTKTLAVLAKFVRAGGGTTAKAYVQTTLDNGSTWMDVASLAFATTTANQLAVVKTDVAVAAAVVPTDGTMTDDTILDGVLGDRVRVKLITVGTYSGASHITVTAVAN
jgi:hypothetical protein